ncbi:Gfo/Idh/MocA family oxidoreductase [Deinococcus sp.]|uniref:NAD(P)H-dependent oxidoreductase n=1 Tax=Deinococcus sp. TaxID=47478 RepID=UPI00286E2892|nr:Gfo/Idh/MocA family oxidoreductase [Deinococcus sp.]
MIIVDTALRQREAQDNPVRVGMIGAGFMGRGVANQIVNSVPGMRLVAVSNRTLAGAERAFLEAGLEPQVVESLAALEDAVRSGVPAITQDASLLCQSGQIDALIDVTGDVEYGAQITLEAIAYGKHLITLNAELDATVGPLLKRKADAAGVILTASDGDQPGVQMNLYRFVQSIGLRPLVCGNIKGLQDPYRTPSTQKAFAEKWGQNPYMVTSFADGTKISFEQAIVANGTGMTVERRGMRGSEFSGHVDELSKLYDVEMLRRLGGVVDYTVGSRPGPGVFVLATHDDPRQRHYLNLYKLGEGPLYSFYTPYHLCHFEVPLSVARAVLFRDAVLQPLGAPTVEVVATAKTDLRAGDTIDALGGYLSYGQCETAAITREQRLLPMGLAEGCVLKRDMLMDTVLTYADVTLPADRLAVRLRQEQDAMFTPLGASSG